MSSITTPGPGSGPPATATPVPGSSSSTPLPSSAYDADDDSSPRNIHLSIPTRFLLLPGTAILVGTTLGLVRGSRVASLRFLAENAHRPPTTVRGWYFYNKTKNYRVMMAGLKMAALDAGRLGATAAAWVGVEEAVSRAGEGWEDVSEVAAGTGTAALFSAVYRLPRKVAYRTVALGLLVGCSLSALRASRRYLVRMRDERAALAAADPAATADADSAVTTRLGAAHVEAPSDAKKT
ncbi:hypothetical protein PUNSTDRAFT_132376 [Punctularia strigosozonata HHB-11173 SS5]|uniref:uncharacterized protein n=1 Tax=Punctularia strigosozonata (strain HHB-11173) TaxID=741275 RepID=UPI0004417ADC|nr:uncharacterized protein PUNSTDRAFT_132376 [Punctularia strigosozonata HHB-11173 SS5]EIN10283.1 hypothetical protein PUNSTDRAFT_132376 [Punctularia strigosozonata HHB-11173 SS5]